eukprot:1381904-Amphidinium_carterae.1
MHLAIAIAIWLQGQYLVLPHPPARLWETINCGTAHGHILQVVLHMSRVNEMHWTYRIETHPAHLLTWFKAWSRIGCAHRTLNMCGIIVGSIVFAFAW